MEAYFDSALRALSSDPFLQVIVIMLCTFVLEDPTLIACALLVADDQMLYETAIAGLCIGIGVGDWLLYVAGRYLEPWIVKRKLVSKHRLERMRVWFDDNMFTAIMVSRFVPGLRLPANLAVGMARASLKRYLPCAIFASMLWTFTAVTSIVYLGRAILPLLGELKWAVGAALIVVVILIQRRSYKRMAEDPASVTAEEAPASMFEFWHPFLFYIPVGLYYFWLAVRFRSLTLPTAVNPSIYSGGMIRESKSQILDLVPESERRWFAPHTTYHFTAQGSLDEHVEAALAVVSAAGLVLPIVAKPDQGQRGAGVRPIYTAHDLRAYFETMPRGITIVLQTLAPFKHEVGLMYYRLPSEQRGRIVSVTLKEFPFVVGDGERTLRELIEADDRAKLVSEVYFKRHAASLDRVLTIGERFPLVFAGNHAQGCIFRDGLHLLTPALSARIDEIAHGLPRFFFGRFDIRFRDVESLQRGEGFMIVEVNGAGAEATHIWDPEARLLDAYRTLFDQYKVLFVIGDANRRAGHAPLGPLQFIKDVLLYRRLSRNYPIAG